MKFTADLHVHSKYSRATSKQCDLEHLSLWGKRKGIQVVGTGDFTHPGWLEELREKLEPAEEGLFGLKREYSLENKTGGTDLPIPAGEQETAGAVRFLLSAEISNIYRRGERIRKVHNLILAPSFEAAQALQVVIRVTVQLSGKTLANSLHVGGAGHHQAETAPGPHGQPAILVIGQATVLVALQIGQRRKHETVLHHSATVETHWLKQVSHLLRLLGR